MSNVKGLRLSAIGAVIFLLSLLALLFLPTAVGLMGILVGGILVWSGFIWTMAGFYFGGEG